MADQQHGAVVVVQHLLQQVERFHVKVVGGLVQHQQVAFARQKQRQQQARLFAARQRPHRRARLGLVKQEILEIAHHMTWRTPHHDLIVAPGHAQGAILGQGFPKRLVQLQLGTVLVEHHHLQAVPQPHQPAVRFKLAGQDVQQRRLAGAIGADQGHPFAPHDADGKIAQDFAPVIGFRDVFRLDHQTARFGAAFQLDPGDTLARDLAGALGPQGLKAAHPSLVAFAPRADALDGPACLGLDQTVELVTLDILFLKDLVAPFLEMGKPLVQTPHLPAIDPQRRPCQCPQKGAVVADDHIGRPHLAQLGFKPGDGLDIQVVCGLVQQHQIGGLGNDAGQRRAPPLAARGARRVHFRAQFQPLGGHLDAPLL